MEYGKIHLLQSAENSSNTTCAHTAALLCTTAALIPGNAYMNIYFRKCSSNYSCSSSSRPALPEALVAVFSRGFSKLLPGLRDYRLHCMHFNGACTGIANSIWRTNFLVNKHTATSWAGSQVVNAVSWCKKGVGGTLLAYANYRSHLDIQTKSDSLIEGAWFRR